jgi:PAS domain S-box-containing protein
VSTSLDDAPCGVLSFGDDGVLVAVNEAAATLLGHARSAMIGQSFERYLPVASRLFLHSYVIPVLTLRGKAEEISISLRPATGDDVPVLLNAVRREHQGRFLITFAFLAMHRRHLYESELLAAKKAAEEAVRAEQEAMTRIKDIQTQLALTERLAAVGTLAAGVAHEINNPLAYVSLNLEMLSHMLDDSPAIDGPQRQEMVTMVAEMSEGVERIRVIVSSLRSLSRGDEERRTPLDVRCAVAVAARMTANELRFRARLETTLDPVPLVDADEGRLGQVFINLLVNAAQAMSQGAIADNVIRIVTRTDAEGRAVIEVHDNGPGISAEVCRRIFDPFFTTKPVGAGTGLGLSICHGIVTSLGGTIVVTSEVGVGSCFRVTLPASSTAGPTPRSPRAIDQSRGPPASPARRARILVIDDDQLVAQTTARSLRDHDVVVVNDGKTAAARLVAGERFDVIVCDLMMPGMTGMDVHATLAEARPALAKRMIFMTGGASDASAQSFLERTSNPRLAKPFQGADLRAAVEKMLG